MSNVKPVEATTLPTVAELAAQAVGVLSLNAGDVVAQIGDLTVELRVLRRELALALGLKSYEDWKLPGDLRALLDDLDSLAEGVRDSAMGIYRAVDSLDEALS